MRESHCTECGCLLVYVEEIDTGLCKICLCGIPEYEPEPNYHDPEPNPDIYPFWKKGE